MTEDTKDAKGQAPDAGIIRAGACPHSMSTVAHTSVGKPACITPCQCAPAVDSPSLTHRGAGVAHRCPAWGLRPDAQSAQGRLLAKQPLKYLSNNPAFHHAYTAVFCNRSTRFASPFSDRPRLIPELEKTHLTPSTARDAGSCSQDHNASSTLLWINP